MKKNWKEDENICILGQRLLYASEAADHLYVKYGEILYEEHEVMDIMITAIDYKTISKMTIEPLSRAEWNGFKEVWAKF